MRHKPISDKQLQANRLNAQRSTGPRTPEGKARSAQNALKHGLLAKSVILPNPDPAESPEQFNALLESLTNDIKPQDTLQRLAVERIAASYWRLRRAYRFEAAAIHRAREHANSPVTRYAQSILGKDPDQNPLHTLPGEADLKKLIRYESMIDRELNRTLHHLRNLKRTNPDPPPTPAPPENSRACPIASAVADGKQEQDHRPREKTIDQAPEIRRRQTKPNHPIAHPQLTRRRNPMQETPRRSVRLTGSVGRTPPRTEVPDNRAPTCGDRRGRVARL